MRLPGQAALARKAAQLEHGVALRPTIVAQLAPWIDKFGAVMPEPVQAP
ncbi:hypothetical protein [Cupriavidus sp. BIC8F]|nr:hypothetical protein [Cupriavidus sp. BIC8F]